MAKEKIVHQKITTPKGTLIYPWLTKPDTKFNPSGEYRTTLAIPEQDAEALCKRLDTILDAFYNQQVEEAKPQDKKKIKMTEPYAPQYADDGTETGNILIKAKLKAEVQTKSGEAYKQSVKLFDAQGNALPSSISPYGGSQAKLSLEIVPYLMPATKECGLSLRLKAAQILQLVESGAGGNADSYGFGKEDGYVADSSVFEEETEESATVEEDF